MRSNFSADTAWLIYYFCTPAPALRSKGETVIAADIDAQATEEEIATALENADPSDVIVASSGVVDTATWLHQRQPTANCGVSFTQFRT